MPYWRSDWQRIPACRRRSSEVDAHVGARIRVRREALGMSRVDLARAVHVSRGTLRSCETGTVPTTPAELCAIATILGVSLSCFFEEECREDGAAFLSLPWRSITPLFNTMRTVPACRWHIPASNISRSPPPGVTLSSETLTSSASAFEKNSIPRLTSSSVWTHGFREKSRRVFSPAAGRRAPLSGR